MPVGPPNKPSEGIPVRHRQWNGAAAMVATIVLSFCMAACAASDTSVPTAAGSVDSLQSGSQVALTRLADTLLVDRSLRLRAILPALPSPTLIPVWSSSDTSVALVTPGG